MARSSALTAIAANSHAKWGLLIDVADIPTTLQLTTLDDQPTDFSAYRAWMLNTACAIGPELDWRGGLAADTPFSIVVQQGFASSTGTATNNTFERWFAMFAKEQFVTAKFESTLLNGGSGDVTVKLASYDGTPTGQSTTIWTGNTRNISMDDYSGLMLEFRSKLTSRLDRAYLARLGREPSGQENYDTVLGRPIVAQSEGQPVPIVYGVIPYAEGLYVHEGSTQDITARSGLIICFSDIRFNTNTINGKPSTSPSLTVYDPPTDELLTVENIDLESGTSGGQQFGWTDTSLEVQETNLVPTGIGSGSAPGTGHFVYFRDEVLEPGTGEPSRLAAGGRLLLSRRLPLLKMSINPTKDPFGSGVTWTDHELASDDDDTTFAYTTYIASWNLSSSPAEGARHIDWEAPQLPAKGALYRVFLLPKYTHTGAAGNQTVAGWLRTSGRVKSYDYATAAATAITASSYNSWTGADSKFKIGWEFISDVAPSTVRGPVHLAIVETTGLVAQTNVYGGDLEVWWDIDWLEYRNKVYAWVKGVRDNTYELESGTNATLRNPAEVFWHFCVEVAGLSVDTSNLATVASQMDTDGLLIDVQLTDGDESAGDFLDNLARQFMCHIYPNDDGEMRLVYRPGQLEPVNYDDPITMDDVVKGTFRTYLTDDDELYAGVIVNYKWNAPRQKYEGQWVITPAGHEIETNVSSPTEYQGLADMVDVDRERVLEVNADMIQDDDTAELLCKWLLQQHCRRRQVIEFETTLARFEVTPGDVICVDTPHIRIFASATSGSVGSGDLFYPGGAGGFPASASRGWHVHRGDHLIVESGAQAGNYIVSPASATSLDILYSDVAYTIALTGPFRVIPTFDVLTAKIIYDRQKGPRMAIKAIERAVIRAGSTDI